MCEEITKGLVPERVTPDPLHHGAGRDRGFASPTLYLRARDPRPGAEPAPVWSLPHAEVTVPGDHFTVLEEHARTTALAVHPCLATAPGTSSPIPP